MKTFKVLEVIRQGQVGGGESHLIDLISGFGPDVSPIVLAFTPGQMIDLLRERGIKCYVIETGSAFDFRVFKKIREIIVNEKIHLIHAHGSRAASNLILTSLLLKIPMVYTVHGWSFHQDQSFAIKKLRILSEKIICAFSRKVICVSESNKISGKKAFGLKKAIVIENGINLQKFNPNNSFKNIRNEFGINSDDFVVGLFGRITVQKDPISFIKAIEAANLKEKRIKGLLVGDGDLKKTVLDYIEVHKLNDIIFTTGFRNDIPDLLNAIDVFCLPSLWEGLSIALLEAMAMKCAVLVTPTDGTSEIITDKINGTIAEFHNEKQLSEKIIDFFNDPDSVKSQGENARLMIINRFDSRKVSISVSELYHQF